MNHDEWGENRMKQAKQLSPIPINRRYFLKYAGSIALAL